MKLKDTLPTAPILVEVTDLNSEHGIRNYAKATWMFANGAQHQVNAHYSEFLTPESRAVLKQRIHHVLEELIQPDKNPALDVAKIRTSMTEDVYNNLVKDLKRQSPHLNVNDKGKNWNIIPKQYLVNIEKDYRSVMPILAKRAGILFEHECNKTPQIIITDSKNIAPIVPSSWMEKKALAFAEKQWGGRAAPDCDHIYLSHGVGLYDKYIGNPAGASVKKAASPLKKTIIKPKAKEEVPEIDILLSSRLGHELLHHHGLDEVAAQHAAVVKPLLLKDREYVFAIGKATEVSRKELEKAASSGEVVQIMMQHGLLDNDQFLPAMLSAMRDLPPPADVRIGKDIPLAELAGHAAQLSEMERAYLKKLVDHVYHHAAFAYHTSLQADISTGAMLGTYNKDDEILPAIIGLQSQVGVDAARALYKNSYPEMERIMKGLGVDITQSVDLTQKGRPGVGG